MRLVKILDTDNITVYLNPMKINCIKLGKDYVDEKDMMLVVTDSQSVIRTSDPESLKRIGDLFKLN